MAGDTAHDNILSAANWVWNSPDYYRTGGGKFHGFFEKLGTIANEGLSQPDQSIWCTHEDIARGYAPASAVRAQSRNFSSEQAKRMKSGK